MKDDFVVACKKAIHGKKSIETYFSFFYKYTCKVRFNKQAQILLNGKLFNSSAIKSIPITRFIYSLV